VKNKVPIDGKIPEKYNSRPAAAYKNELIRAVEVSNPRHSSHPRCPSL